MPNDAKQNVSRLSFDKEDKYESERYNSQALIDAYPYTVGQSKEKSEGNESSDPRLISSLEAMEETREQALDSYREGTVEALKRYKPLQ